MKTPLLKSNLLIKPSILLVAAVLTALPFLSPSARAAEPAYLMPTGRGGGHTDDGIQPFDQNPAAAGSNTRQFLTYGVDADGNAVPLKTLRITNNTAGTVYPIMRDPNSKLLVTDPGRGSRRSRQAMATESGRMTNACYRAAAPRRSQPPSDGREALRISREV